MAATAVGAAAALPSSGSPDSPSPVPQKLRRVHLEDSDSEAAVPGAHEVCLDRRWSAASHRPEHIEVPPPGPEVAAAAKSVSDCSLASRKRKNPGDQMSTGTLKMVFKRNTTDNFVVKNSLEGSGALPKDMKPVVNLEKSDSEYEFDSRNEVLNNQPVLVRRRTSSISLTSRQTSMEARSECSSNSSFHKGSRQSSEGEEDMDEEEEEEEEGDEDDEEDEDESESESRSSISGKLSKEDVHQSSYEDVEAEGDKDAFETDDQTPVGSVVDTEDRPALKLANLKTTAQLYSNITSISEMSQDSGSKVRRRLSRVTRDFSEISDDVFTPDLLYPGSAVNDDGGDPSAGEPHDNLERSESRNQTTTASHPMGRENKELVPRASSACVSSASPSASAQEEEFVAESPVSNMEKEAAQQGLPNTSLFSSSNNRKLLETEDMYSSSDDEENNHRSGFVSSFEIDNRDPQNSMINDSVRSAINSVLNSDDDEDNSHMSWSSSAHPSSRPSIHHRSVAGSRGSGGGGSGNKDTGLDAAVQSILNS